MSNSSGVHKLTQQYEVKYPNPSLFIQRKLRRKEEYNFIIYYTEYRYSCSCFPKHRYGKKSESNDVGEVKKWKMTKWKKIANDFENKTFGQKYAIN